MIVGSFNILFKVVIIMPKYETTMKIKPRRDNYLKVHGVRAVLELVFYRAKDSDIVERALEFLTHVKERRKARRPFLTSEWESYLTEKDLTQSQYYNVYSRLLGAGLIRVERRKVVDCEDYSSFLSEVATIWDRWRAI